MTTMNEEFTGADGQGKVPGPASTPSAKRPADNSGKSQPAEKISGEKVPGFKTQAEVIDYLVSLPGGLDVNDATKLFDRIKSVPIAGGTTTAAAASIKTYKEELETALDTTALDESLKAAVLTIFEGVVNTKVAAITEEIKAEYDAKIEEGVAAVRAELETKVSEAVAYFGEKYVAENKAPIVSALKVEVATSFFEGIKGVFAEHNVAVPDDQVSAIEELSAEVSEIEEKLNKTVEENITLAKEVLTLKAAQKLEESIADLTDVEKAKIRELAENVEFTSVDEFSSKVKVFIESFANKSSKSIVSEEVVSDPITESATPEVPASPIALMKAQAKSQMLR